MSPGCPRTPGLEWSSHLDLTKCWDDKCEPLVPRLPFSLLSPAPGMCLPVSRTPFSSFSAWKNSAPAEGGAIWIQILALPPPTPWPWASSLISVILPVWRIGIKMAPISWGSHPTSLFVLLEAKPSGLQVHATATMDQWQCTVLNESLSDVSEIKGCG